VNIFKSKESVGKLALAVTSATTIIFGGLLCDSIAEGNEREAQLGKAQLQVEQNKSDYKKLEQKFLSVESESHKLSKRQEELMSQVKELNKEKESLEDSKKSLEAKNKDLEVRLRQKQLREAQAKKQQQIQQEKEKQQPVKVTPKIKTESKPKQTEQRKVEPRTVEKKEVAPVPESKPKTVQPQPAEVSHTASKAESSPTDGWKKITVVATGYSLYGDATGSDGTPQTATGTMPVAGRTVAVDPSVIPYGSQVKIPSLGGGIYVAEDTGGAINGNRIDIYMSHGDVARQFGRQTIEIYVKQ
jgi:3D (Asp-Asp-Asp) domain-containing protein